MRKAPLLFIPALAIAGGAAPARGESVAATTDLELSLSTDDVSPDPGQRIEVALTLENVGRFGVAGAVVDLPVPRGLELIAAEPADGYDPNTGQWTFGAVYDRAQVAMTLSVEPDAGGAIVLVADLASFDGEYGAYDIDSEPGKEPRSPGDGLNSFNFPTGAPGTVSTLSTFRQEWGQGRLDKPNDFNLLHTPQNLQGSASRRAASSRRRPTIREPRSKS